MIALTWFLNRDGSVIVALAKGLLLSALLVTVVLGAAWLGTMFFAAIGAALGKFALVSGIMTAMAKLPSITSMLL